jgi:hypothetical protein
VTAIAPTRRALTYSPDRLDGHVALAVTYSALGREEETWGRQQRKSCGLILSSP